MNNKYLHLTKGVHIVIPHQKLPIKQPIYFDVTDGRMIFAIPRGRTTYIGTTDTTYIGDLDRVVATKNDANYLLKAINRAFPNIKLRIEDIESNWAGLRPLIHKKNKAPSELSRKDELFISKSGLISIAGGKLTGYRKMAHRAMDAVLETMTTKQKSLLKPSKTEDIALVTPTLKNTDSVKNYQKELELKLKELDILDTYYAWYLCSNFGKQSDSIIEKSKTFENETPLERLIRAELWFCIQHEMTNTLSDFFVRRTGRLYFNIESVSKYKHLITEDFIQYFNWSKERILKEESILNNLIKDATIFYDEEFK